MHISLCALRLDLDVDSHRLADAGHGFSCGSKHQIEVTPRDRIGRHRPARSSSFIDRGQQFYVQRDRSGHAVHRYVAEDVATLRTGLLYAAALKRHLRKFFHIEEFRAAEVVVAFFDARIDTAHINLRRDRRVVRMFPIDFDLSAEVRELAVVVPRNWCTLKPIVDPDGSNLYVSLADATVTTAPISSAAIQSWRRRALAVQGKRA